jgi:hypothetical protein
MSSMSAILPLAAALAAGGASDQQDLEPGQGEATATALERGRFELNCPAATALSQELVPPSVVGWRTIPITRSEHTVGVDGCGQRATDVVQGPQGDGGFAAAGGGPGGG